MGELIYVVTKGEFELVHELADGGEELVKVAGPGDYFGEIGVLFHMPRAASARARTDATVVGYTAPAFRERLGAGGAQPASTTATPPIAAAPVPYPAPWPCLPG